MTVNSSTEIAIVGAGIAGTTTAYNLAGMGAKVTLIEKEHPAAGPTGRSTALCHLFYLMPELSQLARRGVDWLKQVPEFTNYQPVVHESGMLWCVGEQGASDWALK